MGISVSNIPIFISIPNTIILKKPVFAKRPNFTSLPTSVMYAAHTSYSITISIDIYNLAKEKLYIQEQYNWHNSKRILSRLKG